MYVHIPAIYALTLCQDGSIGRLLIGAIIFPEAIEEFFILEAVVVTHYTNTSTRVHENAQKTITYSTLQHITVKTGTW